MMSSAAVASGGAVAAGSLVATMQSIGAVGVALGPVGWVAFGTVGLLLGGRNLFGRREQQQQQQQQQ
ncbi:hypothetical protein BCR44DRAFT_1437584 [Catenaria anguillulae PL171]|uniref:Uncharacterized protein n=1 Tax=Catenaria anguillulae PL171 TaxID=765915 RepID=A0A1Y2HGR5_9FUNG|nr:hypothetical protein BCR44DRAFT_1437584 [Catenaria anguillulae PL171]